MIEITDFRDRLVLTMSAIAMGEDLCVALYGGDRPHIGAVAISQPRPSLADPAVGSATTSVVAVLGHKEDMLARQVSARLAAALGAVVSVTCGIHVDGATAADIAAVGELAGKMTEDLIDEVLSGRNGGELSGARGAYGR
ncbi:MAG: hypothetical protein GYA47_09210 [Desulfovibrio sp.]|nr:hypothetical protein [Desulfovibrio sp.]